MSKKPIQNQIYKDKIEALRLALIEGEKSGVSDRSPADILLAVKNKHGIAVKNSAD